VISGISYDFARAGSVWAEGHRETARAGY